MFTDSSALGQPSLTPTSPSPSSPPSSSPPSSLPTPACDYSESLYRQEIGPDRASWAGATVTTYQGIGTDGDVFATVALDDGDGMVSQRCVKDRFEQCATVEFDFGNAAPGPEVFFQVSLGNSTVVTYFDDETTALYTFCLDDGAIVRAPTMAPSTSPAPTTGEPSIL